MADSESTTRHIPQSRSTVGLEGTDKEPLCFVVRKSDGQFLRGARFWKWTRNWRCAALLTPTFVEGFCLGKRYGIESMEDIDLYTAQIPSNAEVSGGGAFPPSA